MITGFQIYRITVALSLYFTLIPVMYYIFYVLDCGARKEELLEESKQLFACQENMQKDFLCALDSSWKLAGKILF